MFLDSPSLAILTCSSFAFLHFASNISATVYTAPCSKLRKAHNTFICLCVHVPIANLFIHSFFAYLRTVVIDGILLHGRITLICWRKRRSKPAYAVTCDAAAPARCSRTTFFIVTPYSANRQFAQKAIQPCFFLSTMTLHDSVDRMAPLAEEISSWTVNFLRKGVAGTNECYAAPWPYSKPRHEQQSLIVSACMFSRCVSTV